MQSSATLGLVLLFYLKCDVLNSVFGAICDYLNIKGCMCVCVVVLPLVTKC